MTTDPTPGTAATSDATGLREAVEALAATLWLLVCHGDPTWNFNALPEYAADEHREQARAILASDWLAAHDAEVARTAAKEAEVRWMKVTVMRDGEAIREAQADAYDKGVAAGQEWGRRVNAPYPRNPYREEGRADVRM